MNPREVCLCQTLEFLNGQSQGLDLGLDTAQLMSSEDRDASQLAASPKSRSLSGRSTYLIGVLLSNVFRQSSLVIILALQLLDLVSIRVSQGDLLLQTTNLLGGIDLAL
jgi:hypothetical protein